ncbi:MAG: hypothetical protein Q9170_004238 [Blastenia crenularia]
MVSEQPEPIAIVGSGCRFPGGASSPSALWKLIENPRDVAQDIPEDRFNPTGHYHADGGHHGTTNVRQSYLLQEDLRVFDAAFFNISPNEADSIDPQQRLLLETVYEALESGGHPMEKLRGSDTAVYVGTMNVDYHDTLLRDLSTIPTYLATGTNRAIISNRLSYFFDWHGPSMTIETACSSSLIATHQAVQALRIGESRVAVACGAQAILGPEVFVFESKLKMLSPTSRSRMWSEDADGYARGEGVAAIVMKRLSDAIADGDHIECLIRGTGANQDGHSTGLTVPSSEAQAALIRQTYARAGLNLEDPRDRPQFFEAHGTGTQTGDPKEAAAIHDCFGREGDVETPLYVGSIKTVIGHTEGAAGLAGLLKASGIIQKGVIPPNLLFNRLNPKIEPFYHGLEVSTSLKPWPKLSEGVPRRASVNSFGFGGSNAHAILEEYSEAQAITADPSQSLKRRPRDAPFTPFVFSAISEASLIAQLEAYSTHLKLYTDINASDLAWTLHSRRSHLPVKTAFSALTIEQLISKIDDKLDEVRTNPSTAVGIRSTPKTVTPHILGVFTGQGAQWAAMGGHLIRSSEFVRSKVETLEECLATLPTSDRPQWSLLEEMLAGDEISRIAEAELSQPLCTAIQIILVDLLKIAGITFSAVVGHSSGEIGAAYAAGFISATDALRVAYYRGLYARQAGNSASDQIGAMLAVGTSWEDAQDHINRPDLKGKVAIAAHNSSASVTLSGDADAIVLAKKMFDQEKKFARLLKVDTAYHSLHMLPCGDPYIRALRKCGVQINRERSDTSCSWFSSVAPSRKAMEPHATLQDIYWRDNMTNAVLFADAVKNAVASDPNLSFALEVGPHPALKGPATQNMSDVRSTPIPYSGVLSRGKNDVEMFMDALGLLWTHLGAQGIDFQAYGKAMHTGKASQPKLQIGLPSYQWNHGRTHWHESRRSRMALGRTQAFHELLGVLSPESTTRDMRWTNILKVSEIPWLEGHKLQGQAVFPAAGYVAMALEAARTLAADKPVELYELHSLTIPKAIAFEEDVNVGVETLVTLTAITTIRHKDPYHQDQSTVITTADFSCYAPSVGSEEELEVMASGNVKIIFGTPDDAALSCIPLDVANMGPIDTDRFYSSLSDLGYGYTGPFRGMSALNRKLNQSSVQVSTYPYPDPDSHVHLVHPTMLDVAFQASILAHSAPGDEHLWSLHVPTSIGSIRVNPALCATLSTGESRVLVDAVLDETEDFNASIDIFSEDGQHGMIQVEDLAIKPFAPATKADDRRLFSYTKWDLATPDGASIVRDVHPSTTEVEIASACERISYYYLRRWKLEISDEEWANSQSHYRHLKDFVQHTLSPAFSGQHPYIKREWSADDPDDIKSLIDKYPESVDIKLLAAVGKNIPAAVRGQRTILEHMLQENMLDDFYRKGLGFARYNELMASMVKQITHRYPHARILEIGAGLGEATKSILASSGSTMSAYTYTDVSESSFGKAAESFKAYKDRMTFKTLNIEETPANQGFELHSHDIVIAPNVLHATSMLQGALENTRELLKPGGYLIFSEMTNNGPIRNGTILGGLPEWWISADDGRKYAPTISPGEWHSVLRKTGFSGVETITPEIDGLAWPFSVMAAQAVDDQVQFLRRPLAQRSSSTSIYLQSVVILGNGSLASAQIADEIEDFLGRFCGEVIILNGLPTEAEAMTLNPMSTFINLVDIDSPIFKGMTAQKMDGLKRLFELAKHILWVTLGAQVDEPYHMASIAFSRVVSREAGHISLDHLDVSDLDHNVSRVIAEYLLRQCALNEWEVPKERQTNQQLLWSKEPEVFLDHGVMMIPRLVHNVDQNARLNASRRAITRTVPISSADVSISLSDDAPPSLVQQILPTPLEEDSSPVRVESSSLLALNVASDTFLFLGVGKDETTNDTHLVLSTTNSNVRIPVASVVTGAKNAGQSTDGLLVAVASELLAASFLAPVPSTSNILVHCSGKDRFLAAAVERRASAKGIVSTFTYDAERNDDVQDPSWIKLNVRSPKHVLRRMLPTNPTHFLDLASYSRTNPSALSLSIAQILPSVHKRTGLSDLSRHESSLPESYSRETLEGRLRDAVSNASVMATSTGQEQVQDLVVPLDQIQDPAVPKDEKTVVHWALDGDVTVDVRPLDARRLFSLDKTYLLVGLTGDLGRSMCEWMVSNGAGCVCLTSRNPKISEDWLESFGGTSSVVKTFAMDVLDKRSLEKTVNEIRASCPPIAGVANGAMVLDDTLFSDMSFDSMQTVLKPKIDGTNNLDEFFYNDELDFFMLFSSIANVMGNLGQANYAAANGYLDSLARQRRRRGLAASAVDIGKVAGIGVVETSGQAVVNQLTRLGLMAISESEFHQLLAETIRAGYPTPEDKENIPHAVVTTGIRKMRDDEDLQGPWFDNPRFSHYIVETNTQSGAGQQDKKAMQSTSEQLSGAESMEQALEIMQECFSAKLRVLLQISDPSIDYQVPLVELGVDSLVAVEVRTWFVKELKIDIPVLKVIGGASSAELCQLALDKLPEDLLAGVNGKQEAPEALVIPAQPEPKATSSGATSEYNSTPAGASSPDEGSVPGVSTPASSRSASSEPASDLAKPSTKSPSEMAAAATGEHPERRFVKSEPISFGQSRFWYLRLLLDDQTTSNVAFYYHVAGNLRIMDLEKAVRVVAARHEALRTCFVEDQTEADQAYQKVLSNSPLRIEHKKIKSVEEVTVEYNKLKAHVFDLADGELLRLVLLSLSPNSHYLLINYHHILMDGVSFQVFLSDLEKAYNGQSLGAPPKQFPDFSAAQRQAFEKGEMDDELKYWQGIFPADQEIPVLPLLPMAQTTNRVASRGFDTHQVKCRLEPDLVARVKSAVKAQRCTPFHFYLAAFKAMLFSFTDVPDLTIGIADANRNDSDTMGSIGFFLNLLTLRFRRQPDQRFADAVVEARNTTYGALGNSRLPFDVLLNKMNVARSSSYSPFFQAFFDYRQGAQENHAWGNCQFDAQEIHPGRTAYDITLDVTNSATDALILFRAQTSLYDSTATNLLMETYVHFVDALSTDTSLALQDTSLFSQKQLTQAVETGRGPNLKSDWVGGTLPHRIDQVIQENQGKTALMDGITDSLTYTAMGDRIEAIAEALQNAGVGTGSRVLVFQQASSNWPCSMLAIMRLGGIYVPLDLRNPMVRLAAVAVDCEPRAILADETTIGNVSELNVSSAVNIDISCVESNPSIRIPNSAQPDTPAAILYTSGSTGTPKGIVVTHSGLRNEIEGYTNMWKLGAERTLQQSAYTFNHSSDQIYTGLVNGGMVYTVPWSKRGDPFEITKILQEQSITYTKATPSEYSLWMQYGGDSLRQASGWRRAFGGGEPLNSVILREFADLGLPRLRVFNSYGPTEISISSTKKEIEYREKMTQEQPRIPCGYSLPNYATYILDEQLKPVPAGMPGEIYLGGAGVSLGYLNNEELTSKHFVPDPYASPEYVANGWTRMYRTGDIAHLQDDGAMVFHNRIAGDTQIKIRGLRIELADIEGNIISAAGGILREAIVTLREGNPDFLVAHVVFAPQHNITDKDAYLEQLLSRLPIPQYMIPVAAIPVDKFFLTNHSKVDRKAMKNMPLPQRNKSAQDDAELTETMVQLRRVWQDVLGNKELSFDITPSTSFFSVGGNSLLVIRLQSRIRQIFNVVVRLVELLDANTLGRMVRKVEESSSVDLLDWDAETSPPVIPDFLKNPPKISTIRQSAKVVLVTGGTSFLAKTLLPQLAASPDIETIHCVAVRNKATENPRAIASFPKVVVHGGDLSKPLLGLEEKEFQVLANEVDVVLHMGAVRSFWDNYHVLRPSNVRPTKELVKLAAPRQIPIHYISTVGVLPWGTATAAVSAKDNAPPTDGTNGYVASRWASERVLERATEGMGVPTKIYRFLQSSATASKKENLDVFVDFVDKAKLIPDFEGWEGRIDMIPSRQASDWLCDGILTEGVERAGLKGNTEGGAGGETRFEHLESPIMINVGELVKHIEEQRGGRGLEKMPGLRWIGRIKQLGFGYLLTSQEATVGGKGGFESKR